MKNHLEFRAKNLETCDKSYSVDCRTIFAELYKKILQYENLQIICTAVKIRMSNTRLICSKKLTNGISSKLKGGNGCI